VPTTSEEHVIAIGTDLELQPAMVNLCESTTLLVTSCDFSYTNASASCDTLINLNFDHVVLMTHKEVLARIPPVDIVYSIMLNEPLSLRCAMNKISDISYLNSSTHAYCFMFNLIGEYSMNDNFLVDHIYITCDRIAELKLAIFSHICYVSNSFYCWTIHNLCDNIEDSSLVDFLHPTKIASPMLACSDLVRTESDLSHPLCLFKHVLPSCAMDLYFIDLFKLRCILDIVSNYLDHIYVSSIYQSSANEAWYKPVLFSNVLAWFDRAHNKFDHRASVRTLDLILQNKIVYIFVPRRPHDYINLTYTCNFS
jgi:hypothetical protein